jgi:hypothetical protein
MANNPQNIRLSACRVRWGGRDLGLTKGGVDVEIKTETKQITVDQFGPSVVNEMIMGRTLTVKCPFAETDLDTLFSLMKQSGSTMADAGTTATGTITFSAKPTANDTVTINGRVFTFVSASPGANEVLIGTDVPECMTNLAAVLSASSDPVVQEGVYTAGAGALTVTYYRSGVAGNSFTLAASAATVASATLTGGVDGDRSVTVTTGSGISMLAQAMPLVLHPADKPDSDTSEDFTVFSAGQSGTVSFSYKIDAERIYSVEFSGYPYGADFKLCKFGN